MNKPLVGLGCVTVVGAVACCGGALGLTALATMGDDESAEQRSDSGLSIDISTPKGKAGAAEYVRECTNHEKDQIKRALTTAGLAEDDLAIKCTPPVNYTGDPIMGYVDLNVSSSGKTLEGKHAVLSPDFFTPGQVPCYQAAVLDALEACARTNDCDVYRDAKEPTLTESIRQNAQDVLVACEVERSPSSSTSPTDGAPVGPELPSSTIPAASANPQVVEPKPVNLETLWTATQKGYLVNEEGRMEGIFKPGQPEGTLVGKLISPSTTEVSGQFKYTEASTGILGFGTPDFIINPYGATSVTWPDGRTLALMFSESEPGTVDYTRDAQFINSSGQQVTLNAFTDSQTGIASGWYSYVSGRGTAESCDPLRERYRLDTKTYALNITQEKPKTTRTDCPAAL